MNATAGLHYVPLGDCPGAAVPPAWQVGRLRAGELLWSQSHAG